MTEVTVASTVVRKRLLLWEYRVSYLGWSLRAGFNRSNAYFIKCQLGYPEDKLRHVTWCGMRALFTSTKVVFDFNQCKQFLQCSLMQNTIVYKKEILFQIFYIKQNNNKCINMYWIWQIYFLQLCTLQLTPFCTWSILQNPFRITTHPSIDTGCLRFSTTIST